MIHPAVTENSVVHPVHSSVVSAAWRKVGVVVEIDEVAEADELRRIEPPDVVEAQPDGIDQRIDDRKGEQDR